MLYSYLPMATVGVEGLIALFSASHSRNIMADSHRNILKSHRRAEYKPQTTEVLSTCTVREPWSHAAAAVIEMLDISTTTPSILRRRIFRRRVVVNWFSTVNDRQTDGRPRIATRLLDVGMQFHELNYLTSQNQIRPQKKSQVLACYEHCTRY